MRHALLALALVAAGCGAAAPLDPPPDAPPPDAPPPPAPALGLGIDTAAMDRSVRPQDDLFGYVNGTWLATTEIPADRSRYGSFDILRERAESDLRAIIEDAAAGRVGDPDAGRIGAAYASYLDSTRVEMLGLAPLRADLDRIDAVETKDDFFRYLGGNVRSFGPSPFQFYVSTDSRNSAVNAVGLWQGGTALPDKSYYADSARADVRAAYVDYLAELHTLAAFEGDARAAAQAVLELEARIADAQWTRVENRDPEARYNKVAWADAVAAYPHLRMQAVVDAAGAPAFDSLIVNQPSFLEKLDAIVAEVPLETWATWARLRTVSEAAPMLPAAFAEAQFGFFGRTLRGQEADRPRWKKAVAFAGGALGESIGRIYVARHYPPEAEARMDAMIRNLQAAMRGSISELDWMGEATKAEALAKLDAYTFKIGYPERWEPYAGLELSRGDLLGNARRIAAWRADDMMADLARAPDRAEWGMTPQTVNAYYNPAFNEIVFPAAILQPPFFDVAADDAVNYGGIGAVIGHEFSHGFDDQGSQYDGDGNLRDWWTEADREEFVAITDRLVAQFDAYEPLPGETIDGRLTLGENIGDLSGLTMAYRAYRLSLDADGDGRVSPDEEPPVIEGFTGDQRFFMGWAQVWRIAHRDAYLSQLLKTDSHSPGRYRAVGPLAHIPAFYDAFDVQPGDALYLAPEDRIKLW